MNLLARKQALAERALERHGHEAQLRQTQEELAELTVAISHCIRGKCTTADVAREVADVEIMLAQVRAIIGTHLAEMALSEKLDKLERKLEG